MIFLCWFIALAALFIGLGIAHTHEAPWGLILFYWVLVTAYWIARAIGG